MVTQDSHPLAPRCSFYGSRHPRPQEPRHTLPPHLQHLALSPYGSLGFTPLRPMTWSTFSPCSQEQVAIAEGPACSPFFCHTALSFPTCKFSTV